MTAVKTSFKTDAQVSHLADNGLPVTSADVRRLMAEKKALREALENCLGHFDTPVARRQTGINSDIPVWLVEARAALRSEQGKSDE
jgi:hypothetical protein